jgi:hypothetical protein
LKTEELMEEVREGVPMEEEHPREGTPLALEHLDHQRRGF